jgi:hypothetical protein
LFLALRLLLFEDDEWLIEAGVVLQEIGFEILYLEMLTSETQHRDTPNVWMVGIRYKQFGKHGRILAGTAASTLMVQEFDAIDIAKWAITVRSARG